MVDGGVGRWCGRWIAVGFYVHSADFPDFFLSIVIGRFGLYVACCFCDGPFFAKNWAAG